MDTLTIMMIVHNELASVQAAVDSIRKLGDVDNIELIVVDNHSSDGLQNWAQTQDDFTYVLITENAEGYGKLINDVRKELSVTGNLLIMVGHYMLTPGCLSRLCCVLDEDERTGAVGGVSNSFSYDQKIPVPCSSYGEAFSYAANVQTHTVKQVLGLAPNVILFRKEALEEIGEFEENILGCPLVMSDYNFRLITHDFKMKICQEAVLWDLSGQDNYLLHANRFFRAEDKEYLRDKWQMNYFTFGYNESLIEMIRKEDQDKAINVLEVGCDCGATLLEIKNRYPLAHVFGSELNENAAAIAAHVADVIVNNIEDKNLPYNEHMFDYIIFGDVLEHLYDPKAVIEYCKGMLKEDGRIIACIPNMMHISVMEQLLRGDFTYTDVGLLDHTHIHLFTYNEIVRMFAGCGYDMEKMITKLMPVTGEQEDLIDRLLALEKGSQRFMYEAFQYVIRAVIRQ